MLLKVQEAADLSLVYQFHTLPHRCRTRLAPIAGFWDYSPFSRRPGSSLPAGAVALRDRAQRSQPIANDARLSTGGWFEQMRRLALLLLGIVLGGGGVYLASNYHVVRTADGFLAVPRPTLGLTDPYADVRNWTSRDWRAHRELEQAVKAYGRGDLVAAPTSGEIIHDLLEQLGGARSSNLDSSKRD